MTYNRSIVENYINTKPKISIVYAIPDHPWTVGEDGAAVRIAMTVGEVGSRSGVLQTVINPRHGQIESAALGPEQVGKINGLLKVGANLDDARPLQANRELSFMGVIPVSLRFVLDQREREILKIDDKNPPPVVKKYLGGKDLSDNRAHRYIIDFFGLSEPQARNQYPELYMHVLEHVKPFRDGSSRKNYRDNWWVFGEARPGMRLAMSDLKNFIATTETSKHRWFTKLGTDILPDQKIRVIACDDDFLLATLSSNIHIIWAIAIGGRVGKGNDPVYNNTTCFDPFPFPDPPEDIKTRLRDLGEELDATRKTVLAENADLTLTGLYNLLEKVRAGTELTPIEQDQKTRGRVLILKELHDQIDAATADAYGWPRDLTDEQILERLVALNAERAREEAAGHVRWLRPDYQIPRFAKGAAAKSGELDLGEAPSDDVGEEAMDFPKDAADRPPAVLAALEAAGEPLDVTGLTKRFKKGGKRIEQAVIKALASLVRWGHVTALPDGRYVGRSQRRDAA